MDNTKHNSSALSKEYAITTAGAETIVDEQKIMEAFAIVFAEVFKQMGKDPIKLIKLYKKYDTNQ